MAGKVIWITGLSGAGKTTLARALVEKMPGAILLDGDELRLALDTSGKAFDAESRKKLALTYARFAKLLADQGFIVIVATISLFHSVHQWNRRNLPGYLEVFLDIDRATRASRDPKGLYMAEASGIISDMAGAGVKVELPVVPDITLTKEYSLEQSVEKILDVVRQTVSY